MKTWEMAVFGTYLGSIAQRQKQMVFGWATLVVRCLYEKLILQLKQWLCDLQPCSAIPQHSSHQSYAHKDADDSRDQP